MKFKNLSKNEFWLLGLVALGLLAAFFIIKSAWQFHWSLYLVTGLNLAAILGVLVFTFVVSNRLMQKDKAVHELNERLAYEMQEIGIYDEKMRLLIELSEIVQACTTVNEATKAIAVKCRKILHFAEGSLYIMSNNNLLQLAAIWGEPVSQEQIISADQCWALRKVGIYHVKNTQTDLLCEHIPADKAETYMCIPLMAQNSIFGLLHLDFSPENASLSDENRLLISATVGTLSLSLANIKLREILRMQSLHDSLTGLFNRRSLEEFLVKEMDLSQRNNQHFAVVMVDIDLFKHFNDKYGHDAGDVVLQEFGRLFEKEIRSSDFACRYGGEEFLYVLHDCDLENAKKRAEEFREKASALSFRFQKQLLEHITISIGIAIFPEDGISMVDLIEAADKALYHAKKTRNQVVAYSEIDQSSL